MDVITCSEPELGLRSGYVGALLSSSRKAREVDFRSKTKKSNSRASLSLSYAARPSRHHLATDSVRVKISSLSATVSPVARLARSPVLTVALARELDNVGAQAAMLSL